MRPYAAIVIVLLAATASYAQAPPQNPQPAPSPQTTVRCAPVQPPNTAQGRETPSQQTTGQAREPLSDRLAQGDGVMCPPNVDPEMQKQPPETGKTPVIPPPGSPGGDPTVRPK